MQGFAGDCINFSSCSEGEGKPLKGFGRGVTQSDLCSRRTTLAAARRAGR